MECPINPVIFGKFPGQKLGSTWRPESTRNHPKPSKTPETPTSTIGWLTLLVALSFAVVRQDVPAGHKLCQLRNQINPKFSPANSFLVFMKGKCLILLTVESAHSSCTCHHTSFTCHQSFFALWHCSHPFPPHRHRPNNFTQFYYEKVFTNRLVIFNHTTPVWPSITTFPNFLSPAFIIQSMTSPEQRWRFSSKHSASNSLEISRCLCVWKISFFPRTLVFLNVKMHQISKPNPFTYHPAGVDPHLPKITYAMALRLDEPPKALPRGWCNRLPSIWRCGTV